MLKYKRYVGILLPVVIWCCAQGCQQSKSFETLSLMSAVKKGNLRQVKKCLNKKEDGFNVNEKDKYGDSPLHYACSVQSVQYGNDEKKRENEIESIIKALVSAGAAVDAQGSAGWTPLHWAVKKKNINVVKILLDYKANPNIQDGKGFPPLHYILRAESQAELANSTCNDIIKCLLRAGAYPCKR